MKWFKHMTDAHRDNKLVEIREVWGWDGIGIWWDLVSRVAEQYSISHEPSVSLRVKKLCQDYSKRRQKLSEYLLHLQLLCLIKPTKETFPSDYKNNLCVICIPNIAKIKDNHQRNLQATCKPLATDLQPEVDVDVEVDKKKKKHTATPIISQLQLLTDEGVTKQTAEDFLTLRKKKRAPITPTALNKLKREANKAKISLEKALEHSCANGWQGFRAEWVLDESKPVSQQDKFFEDQKRKLHSEGRGMK